MSIHKFNHPVYFIRNNNEYIHINLFNNTIIYNHIIHELLHKSVILNRFNPTYDRTKIQVNSTFNVTIVNN
jgi:hypothetical protein